MGAKGAPSPLASPGPHKKGREIMVSSGSKENQIPRHVKYLQVFYKGFAVLFSLYHLYAAQFGILPGMHKHRAVHITGILLLVFLKSIIKNLRNPVRTAVDGLIVLAALAAGGYVIYMDNTLSIRSGTVYPLDVFFGIVMVLVILEATRRIVGLPITVIALSMLIYCYFGNYMPDLIAHRGFRVERIFYYMYLTSDGIFGIALQVASTVIILFVIFGAFLRQSGGGDYFTNLAYGLFGRVRGGPAKISIVGSSLFGMVSGSAIANVVSTGTFTIPLMKRVGYKSEFAGAVESVASTGGQLMPPIMGASAFLIMEILSVSYTKVILAALLPSLLYYFALFVAVDLEAKKLGLLGLPGEQLPDPLATLKQCWLILAAPIMLVYFLAGPQWSPMKSAFWAIIAIVILSAFNKNTRMGAKKIRTALEEGATGAIEASIVCAAAGIIIGAFSLTGLGLKFSSILVSLAGDSVFILLILTMISSLVLGMGMPTVACYVVLAVLVAPALINMGVNPMAAHMFIFYFGIISNITPPVCVAAYAGAGIAQSDPFKTGFLAARLGIVGFIVPFMFVMGPALLFQGSAGSIFLAALSGLIGVGVLAMALEGVFIVKLSFIERALLLCSALILLKVGIVTDAIGYGVILVTLGFHLIFKAKKHETATCY